MRGLSSEYQEHLNTATTTLCLCWRLVREDGMVLGFTDHDRTLEFGGVTYTGLSGFSGSSLQATSDLAADDGAIEAIFDDHRISRAELEEGRYDGARIEVWRVNWKDAAIRAPIKTGILGEVQSGKHGFSIEMRGWSSLLDQTLGRQYQYACDANLGDKDCGVHLPASQFTGTGRVEEVISSQSILMSGLAIYADRWFENGFIKIISGRLKGLKFHIKGHGNSGAMASLSLWHPVPAGLAKADRAEVTAGCDKAAETCRKKFSNFLNFRGFPHMPGNDFVTTYPIQGEGHDGGKR